MFAFPESLTDNIMVKYIIGILLCIASFSLAAQDWQAELSPEVQQQDFHALYEGLQKSHFHLYANRSRDEYDQRFEETLEELQKSRTLLDVQRIYQRFVAFGEVAHARIDAPMEVYRAYRQADGKSFPIFPVFEGERMYVGENLSGVSEVRRGDRIVSVNGMPTAEFVNAVARHISADTHYIATSLLEILMPLYVWTEFGNVEQFNLKLERDGSTELTVVVPAVTFAEQQAAADSQPPVFTLDGYQRESRMLNKNIAYLRPGPFFNVEDPQDIWDNSAFVAFVDNAFSMFKDKGAKSLLLDLRDNPGGDNSFSDHLIAYLADRPFNFAAKFSVRSSKAARDSNQVRIDADPGATSGISIEYARRYAETPFGETFDIDFPLVPPRHDDKFEGQVFVLVNRRSYSNAVNVAAIMQDYGFGKIVGEQTADFATTYGAMETFELPNTGLTVGFPKAHIIRPSGDAQPGGVTPDVAIETPVVSGEEDAVLEQAIELLHGQTGQDLQ